MTITGNQPAPGSEASGTDNNGELSGKDSPNGGESTFVGDAIGSDTVVPASEIPDVPIVGLSDAGPLGPVTITSEDKVAFIDSIVSNSRFEKTYTTFGGKITVTFRSLTSDESSALGAYIIKHGTEHPAEQLSGMYIKFLLSASVSRINGTEIPPMAQPLFETVGKDGHTIVPQGWLSSASYWEGKPIAVTQAVCKCLNKFNQLYSALCAKAEDENFWNPDTP